MGYFSRILYFFIGFSLVYLEQILIQLFLGGGSYFELSDEFHGINVLTRITALYPDPPPLRPLWQKTWIDGLKRSPATCVLLGGINPRLYHACKGLENCGTLKKIRKQYHTSHPDA